jgi:signal transduction histidine kinase/DNA-binding response OmpR family regulator/ligand-binding sensor domain-containing protein
MDLKMHKKSTFKKIRFILEILVFGLFFIISQNLHSQDTGYKYFKNYSYKEYDHNPQNWGMAQAENGIIYVANHAGVLEFDGVSWRPIYKDIPNYTVRSIAIDDKGTIYIGGNDEIGYLAPDQKGVLKYNSLRKYLSDNQIKISDVWKTYAIGKNVYFFTSTFLFRWNSEQRKLVEVPHRYGAFFACGGKLFIRGNEVGLEQLEQMENDGLKTVPVPGGEEFAVRKIHMIAPFNSRKLLIGTDENGLYIHDGKTTVHFTTGVDEYLKENKLSHGIRLSSGDFTLATRYGGLIIIDSHGHLKHIFDKTYGLQNDSVEYVFEDNQGNLWLCLDNGISKIEYASPISIHDERSNLSGIVLSVVKHHNDLYVGTRNGLYYLESPLKFRRISGISSSFWSLLSIDDSLLAATSDGVFRVSDKNNIRRTDIKDLSFVLLPSRRYPDHIWCGTDKGLVALTRKNGRWMEGLRFKNINQNIRYIAEDRNGHLWLVTSTGVVLKVEFPVSLNHPVVTRYDTSHGLPGGRVYVAVAAGHVLFGTEKGLFRFDEKEKRFNPDETLGAEFAGGSDSKPVFRIMEDKNKNIWFTSESRIYQAIPGLEGSIKIHFKPFLRLPTAQINTIYPDPDGKTIWFGSVDGLIYFDTKAKKNYDLPFHTLIRKVLVNGKPVFAGYKKNGEIKSSLIEIDYEDRNIRIEFAAPFFEAESETTYQCLLKGYDKKWTAWNRETWKDYTNLDTGLNIFRVRAKNIYGNHGEEAVFRFKVLPPWYKTWWAFSFYVLIAFLGVYFVVKWRSWKLLKEKQTLEKIVKERTVEISKKNLQLQEQSQKLEEMDKVKSRFFANISHEFRTPLTLIMSPLEEMLSDSQDKKKKEKFKVMLKNSQQLLTYINQLLDLSRFDSGKMKLQASFQNIIPILKGTVAAFHILAQHDKIDLKFQSQEEDISLYFDTQKMEEVMYNLLINAFKFTPNGGKITVSAYVDRVDQRSPTGEQRSYPKEEISPPKQGSVKISVQDTGSGMPKEEWGLIFERFYQDERHKEKSHKGTGIGLSLTKEIINLHHGKIDVHSQEGKGTEFVIQLPMGHEHLKQDEIIVLSETFSNRKKAKEIETLFMPTDDEAGVAEGEENEGVEIEKHVENGGKAEAEENNVILVVEDHPDMRKHIRSSLKSLYNVVEASDGKEGITKAKEIIPDLIVSDIMMPEKDGYALTRELKNDIKTSHIPIILLTAKASEESLIQGLETGADDYITKPFNSKILHTRIKNLIDLRRQLQLKIQRQKMLLPTEIEVSSMDEKFLKEFQDIINKNLSDPEFNVDTLCKKLYMGRSTLFRKIQALTGETPNKFILSYRLERAAQLLKENFGNVTEVALEVGFSSPAYFSKCFKEKFHQSPHSYQASESK